MKHQSSIISIMLIGLGVAGVVITSPDLHRRKEIDAPLNVLGVKRSPYGEVIAMAMQGPIDSYWGVVEGKNNKVPNEPGFAQLDHLKSQQQKVTPTYKGWNERLQLLIDDMSRGLDERTNPTAASKAHKFYLRQRIEKKLRFAYELDPAHYGNYNAYHFFLTEPQVGTHPVLNENALRLADQTIEYCMSRNVDPREALTAAAAAGNVLELMLNDRFTQENHISRYSTSQMRQVLEVMDQAILHYLHLSKVWLREGLWQNLSDHRITEADDRFRFIQKVRESHDISISKIENPKLNYDPNPY